MVDRRAFRTTRPRHAHTRLAAVLLCTGLGVTSAPHAIAAPHNNPNSVASLANDLSQAQKKLTDLQNEQGGIRQEANKTVFELDEATTGANDAQRKVVEARARLDKSQKDVEAAQNKLNSLSRSQYTQGQDSNAVTIAAGKDAVASTLDRASYLRTEADKQRQVVSQLDKVRTQAANEESSLRKLLAEATAKRDDAKKSKDKALEAIQTASRKAADLHKAITEAEARKNEIQSRLDEVKGNKGASPADSATPLASSESENGGPQPPNASTPNDPTSAGGNPTNSNSTGQSTPTAPDSQAPVTSDSEHTSPTPSHEDKGDHGVDYAAADDADKERATAAADAKKKADSALAAAKDAKDKEDKGDPTADQARELAANLATIASEAVKRVEELTEKLRQLLGSASDASSNDADKALIGLTSSGLAALAAGLKASQHGDDPVTAAVQSGQQAARHAWDQINNKPSSSPNTNPTPEGNSSISSQANGSTNDDTDNSTEKNTNSGDSSADSSDPEYGAVSTTSQLVNGLKNNSDALNRVTDGTDQASIATSVGGGATTNSSATGTNNSGDTDQSATSGSAQSRINAVIARAQSQLGVRYSWGGGNYFGPTVGIRDGGIADQFGDYAHTGFDCSGLVLYAFYVAGFKLPHYTGSQYQSGTHVPASQMKRGDLIFYGPSASQHVAIYLGNDQMIEAPESGSVVKISPVRYGGMTPNVVRLIS